MKKIEINKSFTHFEKEKLCNLLECNIDELNILNEKSSLVFNESKSLYDILLKILQQGNNVREATLIGLLCGKLIGFNEAEERIEEEIKEKLFAAFKNNRSIR